MSVSIREELLAHSSRLYWSPLIAVASKPDEVFARLSLKLFGEDAVANRGKAETISFELMMLLSQFPGNRLLRRTRVFGSEIAHGHIFPEIHFFVT